MSGDFATLIKLHCCLDSLTNQGMRSLHRMVTREPDEGYAKKIKGELSRIPMWRDMLATLAEKFSEDASNSLLNQGPVLSQHPVTTQVTSTSHPKMEKLLEVVREHFQNSANTEGETRVIIFSEFRDCVSDLCACLSSLKPGVRPMPFIGIN